MSVGVRLRRIREQTGHTQREVAAAAGISTTHLSDMENDRKQAREEDEVWHRQMERSKPDSAR